MSPAATQLLVGASTPHAGDVAACGDTQASTRSQLVPEKLHTSALLSCTWLLHSGSLGMLQRDSKSSTTGTIFGVFLCVWCFFVFVFFFSSPQQGKILAFQCYCLNKKHKKYSCTLFPEMHPSSMHTQAHITHQSLLHWKKITLSNSRICFYVEWKVLLVCRFLTI